MPNQNDILAQTDLTTDVAHNEINGFYFVTAHTTAGTRFYSNPISTFEYAEDVFNSYIDIINYFDGGHVEIYQIFNDDYQIVAHVNL